MPDTNTGRDHCVPLFSMHPIQRGVVDRRVLVRSVRSFWSGSARIIFRQDDANELAHYGTPLAEQIDPFCCRGKSPPPRRRSFPDPTTRSSGPSSRRAVARLGGRRKVGFDRSRRKLGDPNRTAKPARSPAADTSSPHDGPARFSVPRRAGFAPRLLAQSVDVTRPTSVCVACACRRSCRLVGHNHVETMCRDNAAWPSRCPKRSACV